MVAKCRGRAVDGGEADMALRSIEDRYNTYGMMGSCARCRRACKQAMAPRARFKCYDFEEDKDEQTS